MLAVNMLVISIFGSYQTAQAAEIVAGYTIGQILESILLSFGISIFTTEMIQKGTSATWWDTDGSAALKPYYDDLEQAYEEQRFKVINGGGGQDPEPSPTPAPGTTPIPFPTTVPVAGDIPTFQELVAPALTGTAAFINMTQGAWECMGKAVSNLWDKVIGKYNDTTYDKSYFELLEGVNPHDGYPRFAGTTYHEVRTSSNIDCYYTTMYVPETASYIVYTTNINSRMQYWTFYDSNDKQISLFGYTRRVLSTKKGVILSDSMLGNGGLSSLAGTNLPDSNRTVIANFNLPIYIGAKSDENLDRSLKKEEIWVHPDLQNTYQNNGKLEYPQQAPQPLQIPSGDQLADLSKKLNPEINTEFSPEMAPSYIAELIQQLQKGLNPDPDPDPDPNPNPNPNPDPDPDPNPNPTGSPDPEPTKAPEEDSSNDIDPKNYTTDLKRIFPFCIPFDLVHLIQAFEAEPEAPVFEIPFDLELEDPWTGKKIVNYHHTFKLDFSDYESVIEIFRIFEVIFFIIGLLLITRQQMIKG